MLFLRLHLEMLEKTAPPDLRPKLAEARGVTERIIAEIRRIIAALHPSAVEELGLPAAIRHLSARFRKLYPIKLRAAADPLCRPPAARNRNRHLPDRAGVLSEYRQTFRGLPCKPSPADPPIHYWN